jgi:hypothetical protein
MSNERVLLTGISGWKPDPYDERDIIVESVLLNSSIIKDSKILSPKIDLRSKFKPVYDQETLGSCTANAICSAFEYNQSRQNLDNFYSSRLFLYYNERLMINMVNEDSGACIRDGMKSINKIGICDEKYFPYVTNTFKNKPTENAYKDGSYHKSVSYSRVNKNLLDLKTTLSNGHPIVFGFLIFQNFQSSSWTFKTPAIMPMPSGKNLGGHAVLAVGYDDNLECFIIRNSWGSEWGNNGYFMMPYKFITSHWCMDFWITELVVDTEPEPIPPKLPIVSPIKSEKDIREDERKKATKEFYDKVCLVVVNLRSKFPSWFTRINKGLDDFEINLKEIFYL